MEWFVVAVIIAFIIYSLYIKKPAKKSKVFESEFQYLVLDAGEKVPENKWFQKANSQNKNFVSYKGSWSTNWKYASEHPFESNVKVVGISRENRSIDFMKMAQLYDFKMYLEDDPLNPVNKNARKVMISATVDGEFATKHIGYLSDEIANTYAGIELKISPKSAFIPTSENLNLGVEVTLLQRSAHYLKRKANEEANEKR